MTRVLVLGGTGFLGSHVVVACQEHPSVTDVATLRRSDLDLGAADAQEVRDAVEATGCDVVVNATGRLDGSAEELARANLLPTVTLVQALAGLARPVRLLRLGSAGEYGAVGLGRPVREDDPTWPVTLYGATHLAATHVLRAAAAQELLDGTTLRIFNPVGPGGSGPSLVVEVARRLADAVASGSTAISTGPLTSWRDFVDVRDVGRAVAAAAVSPGLPPVINIGSGRATRVQDLVDELARIAGFDGSVLQLAPPTSRSAGVSWIAADISTARRSLDWEPTVPLVTSLHDVWRALPGVRPAPSTPAGASHLPHARTA